ncbi:uncharacterized protein LOC107267215 isoform X2 [Cephus cinctus]|uniref:Uncharacterized protein LOC107267215 isoform X2 n=1 Tax=Cephus cinctus TaxID=211228 RepID=A0AAJ7FJ06_CEPCN|nr:uncharacterized protein LOC107267215 isoform X2 [Cephus cinctus]
MILLPTEKHLRKKTVNETDRSRAFFQPMRILLDTMNTPTRDFLRRPDVPRRRSNRQALAVIPDRTSITVSPGETLPGEMNAMDNLANSRYSIDSWSPAPSPDELVIQKRGRRRRTIVWSPDLDARKRDSLFSSRDRTPVKSPSKTSMTLRSTPRKRLLLGDINEPQLTTPEKKKKQPIDQEKLIESNGIQKQFNGSLMNGLRGLSHDQLVKMIMDLVTIQEDGKLPAVQKLHDFLLKKMPVADIQPLRERLSTLRQNIYASLVSSNMDESAYSRSYIHLDVFQKAVIEQGSRLVESQHWTSVMQYVFAAWNITKDLPEWERQGLDNTRRNCFKALSGFCSQALKNGSFGPSTLEAFAKKLETMQGDCEDVKFCSQLLREAQASEK